MKKAQLKIQQMAFMILAVFLFFVLAGLFYVSMQSGGMKDKANLLQENQAVLIAQSIANYPEFSCAKEKESDVCIDTDKVITLNSADYKDFWPISYIKIIKIGENAEKLCSISSYPDCNLFNVFDRKEAGTSSASSIVALCRWEKNQDTGYAERVCELGKMIVGYKVKGVGK